jgi:hypothetical protein
MKLQLLATTPNIEALVATAVLTTTSGAQPSILYQRMIEKPEKVAEIVGKIEVQHGSILEHNRLVWGVEAEEAEVLAILLKTKFLTFTRIGSKNWLLSGNVRALIEYWREQKDEFSEALLNSIRTITPNVFSNVRGATDED